MSLRTLFSVLPACLACAALLALAPCSGYAQPSPERELIAISQALLNAVSAGDRTVFERTLAESGLFTDEDGITRSKSELIEQIQPLPPGITGRLRLAEPKATVRGDTAVVTYDALEDESYFGQSLHARYHTTDIYQQVDGSWQLIASQTTVIPSVPEPYAAANSTVGLEGEYQLTSDRIAHVTVDQGKVYWTRSGRAPIELVALGGDVYFQPGAVRGVKIFVRDEKGVASRLIDRRDNNDIIWQKVTGQ